MARNWKEKLEIYFEKGTNPDIDLANQRAVTYRYKDNEPLIIPRNDLSEGLQRRLRVRGNTVSNLYEFKDEIEEIFNRPSYSYSKKIQEIEQIELEKLKSELEKEENELESEIEKIAAQSVVNGEGQVISSGSWPVPGHSRISSPYGYRIHPIFNTKKMHTGIDIPAPTGTPAVAIDSGKVIFSGTKGGYGNTVMIQHDDGKVTLYGHNSKLAVSVGQRVEKGQVVSKIGSTGNSTGPHLHFEVRINGKHVNPVPYIK